MSFPGAMLGAKGALVGKSISIPGKWYEFRTVFTGNITTDQDTLRPYQKIDGQLTLDSDGMWHYGICIQLEAAIKYKFSTKSENLSTNHKLRTNIIQGTEPDGDYHQISPVRMIIVPEDVYPNHILLSRGTTTYSFSLQMTGEILPAPFQCAYGSLSYKLVAYMKSRHSKWVPVAEKIMRFRGYHNLSLNPDSLQPIEVERCIKRGIFSTKKGISVTLQMVESGYLAGEEVPFWVTCVNPRCQPLRLDVVLLQRSTFAVDGAKKTTVATLGRAVTQLEEPSLESVWEGSFKIHRGAAPSYCVDPVYTVTHAVQFRVNAAGYSVLKGEAEVFIGTTRRSIETLMVTRNWLTVNDERSSSRTSSMTSDCSGISWASCPPAYSQLSSRATSFETLPPAYGDVPEMKKGNLAKARSLMGFQVTFLSHGQKGTTRALCTDRE